MPRFCAAVRDILLTVALAAMGLKTNVRRSFAKGWKQLLVGAGSSLFISAFSLVLRSGWAARDH